MGRGGRRGGGICDVDDDYGEKKKDLSREILCDLVDDDDDGDEGDDDTDVAGRAVSRGVCGDVAVLHLFPHRHQLVLLLHQDPLQRHGVALVPHLPFREFTSHTQPHT